MANSSMVRKIRALPIAWRIPLLVALNLFVALAVGGLGWHAASVIGGDLDQLRAVQVQTGALADIDIRAGRLHGLIRQYLANPSDDVLKEAMRRSEELFVAMGDATAHEKPLSDDAKAMHEAARRFVSGFQTLKAINADISRLYEAQVLQATSEMSGLYAILNSTARTRSGDLLAPALVKSHENFVETLIAINVFYFNGNPVRAAGAHASLERMTDTMPVLYGLAGNDLQRDALAVLEQRGRSLTGAIDAMSRGFEERGRILSDEVDASQAAMSAAIDRLIAQGRAREAALQQRSRDQLSRLGAVGAVAAMGLLALSAWISAMIGQSIRAPLLALGQAMEAGARGDWSQEVEDRDLHDELAAMARTVEVFKRNAVEKARLEAEREESDRRAGEAKRRTLQDLLAQMEAHDQPISLAAPLAAAPETEAAEIAAAFNRVLAKFQEASCDRDAAFAELTVAKEAAEAANRAKSSFLATVSEEIREPMDGVFEMLDRLERGGLGREQAALIDGARQSGLSLLKILADVLDYSRMEAGRMELEASELALTEVAQGALDQVQPAAQAKGLAVAAFVDPGLPAWVIGDSGRLRQIMVNLLDNAVKFTQSGLARLHLQRIGRAGDGRVMVQIRVVDTGPGVDPERRARLDRLFAQAEPMAEHGGSGLGLSVVCRLAALMGGSAGYDSRLGDGASFWCVLPLNAAEEGPDSPEPDLMGIRALVVDSEGDERSLTVQELERAGAAVTRATALDEPVVADPRRSGFDLAVLSTVEAPVAALGVLGAAPLLFVDHGSATRFELERLPHCLGFLGRPLSRAQIVRAAALARNPRDSVT